MGSRIILGFGGNFKEAKLPGRKVPAASMSPHMQRLAGNEPQLGRKERRRQREEAERNRRKEFDTSAWDYPVSGTNK